jgi:hypothetical protein
MRPNFLLITSFSLVCFIAGNTAGKHNQGQKILEKASERIVLKREVIKLYPNPSFDGKITVSTTNSDTLHFYIFDLEGTLINQTILTSKEEKTITNLSKGTYIYDVFEKDESVEEGKIIVK